MNLISFRLIGTDLNVQSISHRSRQFNGGSLTPEADEDPLRVFAYRVIANGSDIQFFGAKRPQELSESVGTLDKFTVCESAIIRSRYGDPCAHPHIPANKFSIQ